MTWNYRVIRKCRNITIRKGVVRHIKFYDIHEVYYNKKGNPTSWTAEPVSANGADSLRDLRVSLSMMLCDALKHPILEIVGNKKKRLVERGTLDSRKGGNQ